MKRECYFCGKKLKIEQRASMFCSLRCQELYRTLRQRPPEKDKNHPSHTMLHQPHNFGK